MSENHLLLNRRTFVEKLTHTAISQRQTTTVTKTRVGPDEVNMVGPNMDQNSPYPQVVYMNYDEFYVEGGAEGGGGHIVGHHPQMAGGVMAQGQQPQYYLENPYFEEISNFDEEKNYFWQPEGEEIDQDVGGNGERGVIGTAQGGGNWYRDVVNDPNLEKQFLVQNFTRWRHQQQDGELLEGQDLGQGYTRDFESPSLQKYIPAVNELPPLDYRQNIDPQKNFIMPQYGTTGSGGAIVSNDGVVSQLEYCDTNTLKSRSSLDKKFVVPEFNTNSLGWRHPTIPELIDVFFESDDDIIKSNAAAFLQHVVYENEEKKTFAIESGAVVKLLKMIETTKSFQVQKNASGALRNLTYKNQKAKDDLIKNHGIKILLNLIHKTKNDEIKDEASGVIWNMTSSKELKKSILEESRGGEKIIQPILECLEEKFFLHFFRVLRDHDMSNKNNGTWPGGVSNNTANSASGSHSEQATLKKANDPNMDLFFRFLGPGGNETLSGPGNSPPHRQAPPFFLRNLTGALRNLSSAGKFARDSLRNCRFLVMALLSILKISLNDQFLLNSKICENSVCTLRNLSYRLQEVEDEETNWEEPPETLEGAQGGCFFAQKSKSRKKEVERVQNVSRGVSAEVALLWHPTVVEPYLALLQSSSNPATLEGAAGAIQNLTSLTFWPPSVEIRSTIRKKKGLPIFVELLRIEGDDVICAVARALRNLAIDPRNKELIGKYAMRDLVQKIHAKNENSAADFSKKTKKLDMNHANNSTGFYDSSYGTLPKNDKKTDKNQTNEFSKNSNSNFELSNHSSFDNPNDFRKTNTAVPTNTNFSNSTSADTLAAILATLNEVVKKNPEFARNFILEGGGQRLRPLLDGGSTPGGVVEKFATQLLATLWQHTDLHEFYRRQNIFFPKTSKHSKHSSSKSEKKNFFPQFLFQPKNDDKEEETYENNTLSRPMASQGD